MLGGATCKHEEAYSEDFKIRVSVFLDHFSSFFLVGEKVSKDIFLKHF